MSCNLTVCVLTVRHSANDDRIYYKQVLSLKKRYHVLLMAPTKGAQQVERDDSLEYLALERGAGIVNRIGVLLDAYRKLRRANPCICHFHDYELLLLVPLLRATTRIRLVYDAHEMYRETELDREGSSSVVKHMAAWGVHWYENIAARLCHHIVAADDGVRDGLGSLPLPVTVINNFPRPDLIHIRDDLRQDLQSQYAGRFICIYQGGMSSVRGLFHMVYGIDIARRQCPTLLLLLVGILPPSLRRELETVIKERGLTEHVVIIGEVSHLDVPTYMSIAEIGLVPFLATRKLMMQPSIKLFEYMIGGIPIVGSDLPATAQFVRSCGCGLLYPPGDDAALADAIVLLAKQDAKRKEMGARGYEAVRSQWSWQQMEQRLFAIYDTLSAAV